jgi:hypothetical protein
VVSAQQTNQCAMTAHFSLDKRVFSTEKKLIAKLMCFDAQSRYSVPLCMIDVAKSGNLEYAK